jgi:hypothetical protein
MGAGLAKIGSYWWGWSCRSVSYHTNRCERMDYVLTLRHLCGSATTSFEPK